jgi:hypothetical protein
VKKRNEEWWECPNQGCGAEILFRMLAPGAVRAEPSCFCGSPMRRAGKSRGRRPLSMREVDRREVVVTAPSAKLADVPASVAKLAVSGTRRG